MSDGIIRIFSEENRVNRSGHVYLIENRIAIAIDCINDPAGKAGHTIEIRWSSKAKIQGNSMD